MPNYRIVLIRDGIRREAQVINRDTNSEALDLARAMVNSIDFEVWEGQRKVASVDRPQQKKAS